MAVIFMMLKMWLAPAEGCNVIKFDWLINKIQYI
jgi:hypothetical protein